MSKQADVIRAGEPSWRHFQTKTSSQGRNMLRSSNSSVIRPSSSALMYVRCCACTHTETHVHVKPSFLCEAERWFISGSKASRLTFWNFRARGGLLWKEIWCLWNVFAGTSEAFELSPRVHSCSFGNMQKVYFRDYLTAHWVTVSAAYERLCVGTHVIICVGSPTKRSVSVIEYLNRHGCGFYRKMFFLPNVLYNTRWAEEGVKDSKHQIGLILAWRSIYCIEEMNMYILQILYVVLMCRLLRFDVNPASTSGLLSHQLRASFYIYKLHRRWGCGSLRETQTPHKGWRVSSVCLSGVELMWWFSGRRVCERWPCPWSSPPHH